MNLKTCTHCQETLPIEAFVRKSASPDGHSSICRACKSKANSRRNKRGDVLVSASWRCKSCGLHSERMYDRTKPDNGLCRRCRVVQYYAKEVH